MLKQMKTGLAILFAVLFVVSLTVIAADEHGDGWGGNYPWQIYGYPYYGYSYGTYVGVPYTIDQYSATVTSAQGQYSNQVPTQDPTQAVAPTQAPASAVAVGVGQVQLRKRK